MSVDFFFGLFLFFLGRFLYLGGLREPELGFDKRERGCAAKKQFWPFTHRLITLWLLAAAKSNTIALFLMRNLITCKRLSAFIHLFPSLFLILHHQG